MNMPRRPDEDKLWAAVLAGERPRDAGRRLGMPPRRVIYLCEKWTTQGRYDYGVSADMGWPSLIERSSLGTPEARALRDRTSVEQARRIIERSRQLGEAT